MTYEVIISIFVILGTVVIVAATIGVVRLPDPYSRSHALGKGLTLGILLLLIGLWFSSDNPIASLKIGIAIVFQLVTIPVASHLIGNLYLHLSDRKQNAERYSKSTPPENRMLPGTKNYPTDSTKNSE